MSIGIQEREAQFRHAPGYKVERQIDGTVLTVLIAGAIDVGGMVGPEKNGIAILNKSDRKVVIAEHLKSSEGGYFGPSRAQAIEFERIKLMTNTELARYCLEHPLFRNGSLPAIEPVKERDPRTLKQLADDGVAYNSDNKEAFAAEGRRLLLLLAKELGLENGKFEVRFNPGGIGVSGDHTLHTPDFYLNFDESRDLVGIIRTCDGLGGDEWKRDNGRGHNRPFDAKKLNTDMPAVVSMIKRGYLLHA